MAGPAPRRHSGKSDTLDKQNELKKIKGRALLLLLAVSGVFVLTACLPPGLWVDGCKAVAEAAMVGALADWFAVAALFRRIPLPFIGAHTAIIPANKDRIADNLALFIRDKFLHQAALVGLIRRHDPASRLAAWLAAPASTRLLGDVLLKAAGGMLELGDDGRIRDFLGAAARSALERLDLAPSMAALLDALTREGRHQELLDQAIGQVATLLRAPASRDFIAGRIVEWLKRDHPVKERVLPTGWLSENAAEMLASTLDTVLIEVSQDPGHALRQGFDAAVGAMIVRLRDDPAWIEKGEEIKRRLGQGETLNLYVAELWGQLRAWLQQDIARADSSLHQQIAGMGRWVGAELAASAALRQSLNEHLEEAAQALAPDLAQFLTKHISDTVKNWDPAHMSRQIELNIGKDLQYIRINGTIVGGVIGLMLFLATQLIAVLRAHAGA